jgi:hypothetical protein
MAALWDQLWKIHNEGVHGSTRDWHFRIEIIDKGNVVDAKATMWNLGKIRSDIKHARAMLEIAKINLDKAEKKKTSMVGHWRNEISKNESALHKNEHDLEVLENYREVWHYEEYQ